MSRPHSTYQETKRSETKLMDYISLNKRKVTSPSVLPLDQISDNNALYIIANIRKRRFKPPYKCIRDEKRFISKAFRESAAALPLSYIYKMDDPEDKLDIFNKLVINCLN